MVGKTVKLWGILFLCLVFGKSFLRHWLFTVSGLFLNKPFLISPWALTVTSHLYLLSPINNTLALALAASGHP